MSLLIAVSALGCDGPNLVGKTQEQQVETIIESACDWIGTCGGIQVSCSQQGTADEVCTGRIVPFPRDICVSELGQELRDDFCRALTDPEAEAVGTCLDAIGATPCPTQADADARAAAREMGSGFEGSSDGFPDPVECAPLEDIFDNVQESCEGDTINPPPPEMTCSGAKDGGGDVCNFTWRCTADSFRIECETDTCQCIQNSVTMGSFQGSAVCDLDLTEAERAAETGCNWEIPN